MIEHLEIKNFQTHKHLALDFATGVNVFTGISDVGKSCIIRALVWLLTNKPAGFDFRHWDCGVDGVVSVAIKINGHVIERRRSETVNEYWLDEQKFVAFKNEVPEEIAEILNIGSVNIQTQFLPHYLLSVSSGEVSRTLNDACDLTIIDTVLKKINQIVLKANREADATTELFNKFNEQTQELVWVVDASATFERVKAQFAVIKTKQDDLNALETLFNSLGILTTQVNEKKAVMGRWLVLNKVKAVVEGYSFLQTEAVQLQSLLFGIQETVNQVPKFKFLAGKDVLSIKAVIETCQEKELAYNELARFIEDVKDLKEAFIKQETALKGHIKDLDAFWKANKICPLCGQKKSVKAISKIRGTE